MKLFLLFLTYLYLVNGQHCSYRNYTHINSQYNLALEDSKIAEHHEIIPLMSITPNNPNLTFITIDNEQWLKVVSLTSWSGYIHLIGSKVSTDRLIWVTLDPQLRSACENFCDVQDFDLRLKQLLGLHPNSTGTYIVELLVQLDSLYRPCLSPDITSYNCTLSYPSDVSSTHIQWVEYLSSISYHPYTGYPWTRLGYTYDWSSNTHYGLYEFIISSHAHIIVYNIIDYYEYCCL